MSLTKRQASFDRMMEENREREQLELARREQDFINDRNRKTNQQKKDHGNRTDIRK